MERLLTLMFLCSFFACQEKVPVEPVFTLVERVTFEYGEFAAKIRGYKYQYIYHILIKNVPKDKTVLRRLMTRYFLDLTSAADSIPQIPNVVIRCYFFKSTPKTEERFKNGMGLGGYVDLGAENISPNSRPEYRGPWGRYAGSWSNKKTYVGHIVITRCEKDETKLDANMWINAGLADGARVKLAEINLDIAEIYILLNECENPSYFYEPIKDDELMRLFGEYYKRK